MKQTFEAPEAYPPLANLAAVTGVTAETNLWTPAQWTPIPANYASAGQQWIIDAFGVLTYPSSTPGTTAFTARIGTSSTPSSNTILGAASTAAAGTTQTGVQWQLKGLLTIRTVGLPGANSTVIFQGHFECPLGLQAAGSSGGVIFGGTATVDLSVAQGLAISVTPSVTGQSFTPQMIAWRSLG